jgi:energy-coupling factor transporter ATP-binding protein EcfA2
MRIAGIKVQKYRSIESTQRMDLGDLTVFVGPNNEGKSNILRALSLAMRALRAYGAPRPGLPATNTTIPTSRTSYSWADDFPKKLQDKQPEGNTLIDLWFELDERERTALKHSTGSRLRSELPIRLAIGERRITFKVAMRGPAHESLNQQSATIARFIGRRVGVEHVEAVRTARNTHEVVNRLLRMEMLRLEEDAKFKRALGELRTALNPVSSKIGAEIHQTLKDFMPDVSSVRVEMSTEHVIDALSSKITILVDDGAPTALEHKGDGAQSLAALALARGTAGSRRQGELLLALEEPESHLHPTAVHQLRAVLNEISENQQVVISTHSPILVNRQVITNNIVVRGNKATPARTIADIRDALGVRVSDNLHSAQMILLVEGQSDQKALTSLLSVSSTVLATHIADGRLVIEPMNSAANLSARVQHIKPQVCRVHAFLDADQEARAAYDSAERAHLLTTRETTLATCPGLNESEFEDLVDPAKYVDAIRDQTGIDLDCREFKKGKVKWSARVELCARAQGKPFTAQVKSELKAIVTGVLVSSPADALHPARASSFEGLVAQLERRLATEDA